MSNVIKVFVLSFFALACGEKGGPTIVISFTGNAGVSVFSDLLVSDLVLGVVNVPSNNAILDQDSDGQPDFFAFPRTCGSTFAAKCGYSLNQPQKVEIGQLPLNFLYEIEVRFRDQGGQIRYSGSTQFSNDGVTLNIAIPIFQVSSS